MAKQAITEAQVPNSDLQALERFVVDNDDLLALEELIGRFNIFDALRIVKREVKHSDFLSWLLDPNESHGQGGLFLRAILMDLFKTAREAGFPCPVSPIELDGEDLRGVEIRREWRNIDLLICCDQPNFVVAIENKIYSSERGKQLDRYREIIETEFPAVPSLLAFLTIEGDEPTADNWVAYSYGDLHRVLTRLRNANATSIGADVLAFLDHYLRLIRGRLMDDPAITELCQRIYKNHRQALQLIFDHAGSPAVGLLGAIEATIANHPGDWQVINSTSKQRVIFVPNSWNQLLPEIGTRATFPRWCWVVLRFEIRKKNGFLGAAVWPTSDVVMRQKVMERLTRDHKEFGFRLLLKTTSEKWSQLGRESIGSWPEDEEPDEATVLPIVKRKLDELAIRLASIPDALRPIISEWKKSHT